jgi:transcriptional regulator with XRE-family HTH domain
MNPDKLISHLTALRKQRDVSLRELARLADVAPASLSAIEKGQSSPTLATLHKLLQALGTDFTSFVSEMESNADSPVFSADRMRQLSDRNRDYVFAFPSRPELKMQMVNEHLRAGERSAEWERHQCDVGALLVSGGPLKLEIEGVGEWQVHAGDAFYVKEGQRHRATNVGADDARLVSVMVPPRY